MKKVMLRVIVLFLVIFFIGNSFAYASCYKPGRSEMTNDTEIQLKIQEKSWEDPVHVKVLTREEFLKTLAYSMKISLIEAQEFDFEKTMMFEKIHLGFVPSISINSGHYEYITIQNSQFFGPTLKSYIYVTEYAPAKVYVDGSFRQFIYVANPYSVPSSGDYTWYQTYSYSDLANPPVTVTLLCDGYAEVSINSSDQWTLGVQLEGLGFSFSHSVGTIYYYRKYCHFYPYTYSLY